MKLTNEDWKYKIINASPERLVIVTFEIILDRINDAEVCLENGDIGGFRTKTSSAKEFVTVLMNALDMSSSVSAKLADLYIFVNKLLTKAFFESFRPCDADGNELTSRNLAFEKFLRPAFEIIQSLMKSFEKEVRDNPIAAEASANYGKTFHARPLISS